MGAKEGRQGNTLQEIVGCPCHVTRQWRDGLYSYAGVGTPSDRQCPLLGSISPTSERQKPANSGPTANPMKAAAQRAYRPAAFHSPIFYFCREFLKDEIRAEEYIRRMWGFIRGRSPCAHLRICISGNVYIPLLRLPRNNCMLLHRIGGWERRVRPI